jgi:hypothetical protein
MEQAMSRSRSSNTTYTVSISMRSAGASGDYWAETGYRLGTRSAKNFDNNVAAWTLVKKFDSSVNGNGNGNVWTRYSSVVNTGSNTTISVGVKLGALTLPAPTVRWDTLRIE